MANTISAAVRSRMMAQVKSRNTSPELLIRRLLHRMGYRYRLHVRGLPGKPDLVFRNRKKVMFIHGCFWHLHEGCPGSHVPTSNAAYWLPKLENNRLRDTGNEAKLVAAGWQVLVIWECDLKSLDLVDRITSFLGPPRFDVSS